MVLFSNMSRLCRNKALSIVFSNLQKLTTRNYRKHHYPYLRELYSRQLRAGPAEAKPRAAMLNWNIDVELNAFSSRISEELSRSGLLLACTDQSYAKKMHELIGITIMSDVMIEPEASDNRQLSSTGDSFTREYIQQYLSTQLPRLPHDGIQCLEEFVMKEESLTHVANHLGLQDLILYEGFPVPDHVTAGCLKAVIGLIYSEKGVERAGLFVRDFILTQLVGEDIDDIYTIPDPMSKLETLLKHDGKSEAESRLIGQFGQDTLVSCYCVGIYSDKELIGKAFGETVEIAEEMAAQDALMTLYGIQDNRLPFEWDKQMSIQIKQ